MAEWVSPVASPDTATGSPRGGSQLLCPPAVASVAVISPPPSSSLYSFVYFGNKRGAQGDRDCVAIGSPLARYRQLQDARAAIYLFQAWQTSLAL